MLAIRTVQKPEAAGIRDRNTPKADTPHCCQNSAPGISPMLHSPDLNAVGKTGP
jgi:hypothetical protein